MKQERPIQWGAPLDALASPPCENCGARTRFVGLESHPHNPTFDLSTYECAACGHVQTAITERADQSIKTVRNGTTR